MFRALLAPWSASSFRGRSFQPDRTCAARISKTPWELPNNGQRPQSGACFSPPPPPLTPQESSIFAANNHLCSSSARIVRSVSAASSLPPPAHPITYRMQHPAPKVHAGCEMNGWRPAASYRLQLDRTCKSCWVGQLRERSSIRLTPFFANLQLEHCPKRPHESGFARFSAEMNRGTGAPGRYPH